jgi:hypothetical protein
MTEYIHEELNQEISAIGGKYTLVKEVRLPIDGREILYLIGHASFDSTCCGVSGCAYALVPGFITHWQGRQNIEGLFATEVEPVRSKPAQAQIRAIILEKELVHQIQFM